MRIFKNQKFGIYIWGIDHPPPHCHVRFKDGSQVCVTIPLVEPLYGATIDFEVKEAILENLEKLTKAWDKLHPLNHKDKKAKENE